MNINKAIRKQKRSYKMFMLSMCFIFLFLPLAMLITQNTKLFFIVFLICIEILIVMSVIITSHKHFLSFTNKGYKIKINFGIKHERITIFSNKVKAVHLKYRGDDFDIVIITLPNKKNKSMKSIDEKFMVKYPYAGYMYLKVKKINPEKKYFYYVIKTGKYKKYELLNEIYRVCVKAQFSSECIEKIREYRKIE